MSLLFGSVLVALSAILIEYLELSFLSSPVFFLLFLAPVTEEILKFLAMAWRKDPRAAYGTGIGFAVTENAVYFMAFIHSPLLAFLLISRSISDPSLHALTARIDLRTWHGKKRGLPQGILVHASWNLFAILVASLPIQTGTWVVILFSIPFMAGLALSKRRDRANTPVLAVNVRPSNSKTAVNNNIPHDCTEVVEK